MDAQNPTSVPLSENAPMDMRELKALEIAARAKIAYHRGFWMVPSQSTTGTYQVSIGANPSCTCEDFALRQLPCKHVIAARFVSERDHGGEAKQSIVDELPKKPTYKQNWPAYNAAQSVEKERLQELLFDLLRGVPEPEKTTGGRKPHTVRNSIFAMVFKVYGTLGSRRFSTDLRDAHAKGHLSAPVPGLKVNLFMENPDDTPILKQLIAQSALPLKGVEKDFAIDSSGFSASRFERWFDHKYGITRQRCMWVKCHIACGVKTNVVTAVRIRDKDAADSPQFVPLVKETSKSFSIGEVSADKAYASVENFEAVAECGGTGFIAFKSNNTGAAGGLFQKMFHYFQFKQDEYMQHYHKRSNVETTFSMVKRKFGDSVRSKNDAAMENEVLCKLLCHNLCVLIQEQHELGIEPISWKDAAGAQPLAV